MTKRIDFFYWVGSHPIKNIEGKNKDQSAGNHTTNLVGMGPSETTRAMSDSDTASINPLVLSNLGAAPSPQAFECVGVFMLFSMHLKRGPPPLNV
jgi:hypothetical protein